MSDPRDAVAIPQTPNGSVDVPVFLLALADTLRTLREPGAMIEAALAMVGRYLSVNRVGYAQIDHDSGMIHYPMGWGDGVLEPLSGQQSIMAQLGEHYRTHYRAGRTSFARDMDADPMAVPGAFAAVGARAMMAVPLVRDGEWVAGLFVNHATVRDWLPEEGALLEGTLSRLWESIERARAEHALLERTRERDNIWRLSRDLFAIADAGGRWTAVNPAWTRVTGWSDEEIVGRTSDWMEHPDDRGVVRRAVEALVACGDTAAEFEGRVVTRSGEHRLLAWTAAAQGGCVYCVARDVTEERAHADRLAAAEDALRQAQKMEAVGQLTGGLAHDFNNLLTGIMGNLELLERRVARGRYEDIDRFVHAAQGAGRRAANLTQRLLAFSRRQTLDARPTDVTWLIVGLEEMLRRTVGASAAIAIAAAPDLWTARIDGGQLENAVLNLCINARDAMPNGGRITIRTANVAVGDGDPDLAPGDYVEVAVADTGTGMSDEVIARVFEPFFTTKPAGQGTGLGLSMIYGFAKQSGGAVRLRSAVGEGTTVSILLPRHHGEADRRDEPPAPGTPRRAEGQTVLVVDDEATIHHLIDEVLADLGYGVIGVGDGPAAIKVLESGARIDLLVANLSLPHGIGGRRVADAARALRPAIRILFITGFPEHAAAAKLDLGSGDQLLTKPFNMLAIAERVAEMLADPAN